MARGNFGGGNGTESNPYLVEDAADLNAVRNNLTAHYKQVKNINLSSFSNFEPLGFFEGTYLGSGYTISNLKINKSGYIGLFEEINSDGVVRNLHIKNALIKLEGGRAGILASGLYGCEVTDCTVQGVISGGSYAEIGGFSANVDSATLKRCSVNVESNGLAVGGFALQIRNAIVEDCYAEGNISGNYLLDFARLEDTSIKNCFSAVDIETTDDGQGQVYLFLRYSMNLFESCYTDVGERGVQNKWQTYVAYSPNALLRGSDGVLYVAPQGQDDKDWGYWEPEWSETGPPSWWPPPLYKAEPGVGEVWHDYWEVVLESEPGIARTTAQMKTKSNYVGWDFETVWKINDGEYPTLRKHSDGQLEAMPLTSITVVS